MNTLLGAVSKVIKSRVLDILSFAKFVPGFLLVGRECLPFSSSSHASLIGSFSFFVQLSLRDQIRLIQSSLLDILTLRAVDALSKAMAKSVTIGEEDDGEGDNILVTTSKAYAFIAKSTDGHSKAIRKIAKNVLFYKLDTTELALVASILMTCGE